MSTAGQRKRQPAQEVASELSSKLQRDRRSNHIVADELEAAQSKDANRSFHSQVHPHSIGFQTRATSQHQQRKDAALWSSNNATAYRMDAQPPKTGVSDNSHKYIFDKNYTQQVRSTQSRFGSKILSPEHQQRFQTAATNGTNQTSSVPNGLSKRIRSAVKYQTATSKDLFAFQRQINPSSMTRYGKESQKTNKKTNGAQKPG